MEFDIDYVFPYVNNKERVWRNQFLDFCKKYNRQDLIKSIDTERYDDLGLLEYLFKCLDKYMPWLRKIHLIVSNIEQAPEFIYNYPKVNIVLHKDIIPEQYLPTYNSTTIEMYLRRIPDLADCFIYGNDDMFPIDYLQPEDFFTEDKLPKLQFRENLVKNQMNQFSSVCWNCWARIQEYIGQTTSRLYSRPIHSITPMNKHQVSEVIEKMGKKIFPFITTFRTALQHNQYIYSDYAWLTEQCGKGDINFKYISLKGNPEEIVKLIENKDKEYKILCINDTENVKGREQFHTNILKDAFEENLKNN